MPHGLPRPRLEREHFRQDRRLVADIDAGEQQLAAAYADPALLTQLEADGGRPHPAAADPELHALRARRHLMLQLVVQELFQLTAAGGGGGGSGGSGSGESRTRGMDTSACEIAEAVALAYQRRGEQFGSAPAGAALAASVSLTGGEELEMAQRRLTRAADGSLRGALDGLARLAHEHRVTTCPESAALQLLPLRLWGAARPATASAGSSTTLGQWREARVTGADAETFRLLPERLSCPASALLRSTRWLEWPEETAAAQVPHVWRFTELEGYRAETDVAASYEHAGQTRGMAAGRLAFVYQGHGRISLVLVCAHGHSLLVRETRSRQ